MPAKIKTLTQNSYSFINSAWQWLLEAIFPKHCLSCGRWGTWCCAACLASLTYSRQLHCPDCNTPTPLGEFCRDCAPGHYLNGLWPAQAYSNPTIRILIKAFKFDGIKEVALYLVNLMIALTRTFNLPPSWHAVPREQWLITAVPLPSKRHHQRNFNQSEILAQELAKYLKLYFLPTLKRIRQTKPQSELKTEQERANNIKDAFSTLPRADLKGKIIILVDDVYTSGATMEECARQLKAAGALEVWGLVAAKG